MAHSPRALKDYALPPAGIPSIKRRPTIQANNFEIKPITLLMGLSQEDPNTHISNFLEVYTTVKYNGVNDDAICLRLFLFSLN